MRKLSRRHTENIEKTKTLADIGLKLKQIAQREKISILIGLGK